MEPRESEMTAKPLQLSGCVIQNPEGKILLIHRETQKRTQWEIPGGGLEPGEKPEDAAVRELDEELGVTVQVIEELGRADFSENGKHMTYTWQKAVIESGVPRIKESDKFDKLGYFSVNELLAMQDLSANTKNLLTAIAQGRIQL